MLGIKNWNKMKTWQKGLIISLPFIIAINVAFDWWSSRDATTLKYCRESYHRQAAGSPNDTKEKADKYCGCMVDIMARDGSLNTEATVTEEKKVAFQQKVAAACLPLIQNNP